MTNEWRGTIGEIAQQEMDEMLAGGIVCHLAVLDRDGWPYVVPVWFEWDPDAGLFWVVPRQKSSWAKFMANDPRVSLTIDTPEPPYRKVAAQGTADVVEEPNIGGKWVEIAQRMSTRYLGPHGPEYLEATLDQPRWLFSIQPKKLITWQGVDWHPRYKDGGG